MAIWVLAGLLAGAAPAASAEAQALLDGRGLAGAILVEDVGSGAIRAEARNGDGPRDLPFSAVKLLLAAIGLEHEEALPGLRLDLDAIVARGLDDPGRELALSLRNRLGSGAILADLARFGFPACGRARRDCTALSATTPDAAWADALSLGEAEIRATPRGLSHFLRAVAGEGRVDGRRLMRPATARRLRQAMAGTLAFGTARGADARLAGLGGLAGKTGTGPGGQDPADGLFAGFISDRCGRARWTIVTWVRRGGRGGGAAASLSAEMAERLLRRSALGACGSKTSWRAASRSRPSPLGARL